MLLLVVATLAVVGCGAAPATAPPTAVGPPVEAPSHDHSPPTTAGALPVQTTPAAPADLRVSFESLLGHHATLVTRMMRTMLRGDADLVEAANQALVLNTADLSTLIGDLHGQPAKDAFEGLWVSHTDALFDYTRALGADDQAGRDGARAALEQYLTQFGTFLEGATGGTITAAQAADVLRPHLDHLTGFADAYQAGDFAGAYELQQAAFAHMFPMGRALAQALGNPPGQPPAGVEDPSEQLRSTLGLLLGEHFELMVDGMRSAVQGSPEFDAAAAALGTNQGALTGALDSLVGAEQAARFNEAWASHIELLIRYSVAVADEDTAGASATRDQLTSVRDHIAASFSALTGGAIPVEAAASVLAPHDSLLVEQVEAYAAGDYARAHELAFEGYQHMFHTVAAVAPAIETYLAARAPAGGAQTGGGALATAGSD